MNSNASGKDLIDVGEHQAGARTSKNTFKIIGEIISPGRRVTNMKSISKSMPGLLMTALFFSASVAAQTPSAAISHFKAGVKENDQGNFDRAIEDFTTAIEISSHPAQRVSGKSALSNSPEASAELRSTDKPKTVTVLDPFTAGAYANRGFAWYAKGDFARAVADCDEAIRINPRLAVAYLNRAAGRKAAGDAAGALVDLNRAVEIDANMIEALVSRGELRKDLGDIDGAISDLDRVIAITPRLPQAYYYRGSALIAKQKLDAAISDFNQAIRLKPDFAQAYHVRGTARAFKNELETAIGDFSRALELDPKLALAYENRGLTFLLQGKEVAARQDFERCLAIDSSLKDDLDRRIKIANERHVIR